MIPTHPSAAAEGYKNDYTIASYTPSRREGVWVELESSFSGYLPKGGCVNAETETCLTKIGLFSCGLMQHCMTISFFHCKLFQFEIAHDLPSGGILKR